ncbi:hypothetical protein Moror_15352 [Moniliophthora roreri MCA 2997]|uniref:Uncharacterized protein n=1 Tax=Moniliophthora roreri (strain MCA 2997) TaxID=1381753 RepID=V2WLS3_MONRO|nr:hypothetical protein Moror_15352 [Moniliophthora roreri MCA 2997]
MNVESWTSNHLNGRAAASTVTTSFSQVHYTTFSSVIVGPVIITGIQFLLYGLYILLFYGALYVLKHRRPPTRETKFHRTSLIVLFLLATIGLFVNTSRIIWNCSVKFELVKEKKESEDYEITRAMDITADIILLFRCYSIWGSKRRVIVVPAIGCVLSNLLGIISMSLYLGLARHGTISGTNDAEADPDGWFSRSRLIIGVFLIVNAAMNVCLTVMVAGRIWILTCTLKDVHLLNNQSARRYNLIVALVLESGFIYPFALILDCVVNTNNSMVGWDLHPLLVQVAGIAPTLIIVRAGLGLSVEKSLKSQSEEVLQLNSRSRLVATNVEHGSV